MTDAGHKRYPSAALQRTDKRHYSPEYRESLKLQPVWCEGTFVAQNSHYLTRALRRDIEAADGRCLLSAAAINLKRLMKCAE